MSKLDIDNALSYLSTRSQQAAFLRAKCRWARVEDWRGGADWIVAIHPEAVKAYVWTDYSQKEFEHSRITAYNIDYLLSQGSVNTAVQTALHQLGFRKETAHG